MAKKAYIGVLEITNLCPAPSAWSLCGVTVTNEIFAFNTGTTAMASCSMPTPIVGHIYYGRVVYKSPSGFSCADGRFEYFWGDGANRHMVFSSAVGNVTNDNWSVFSNILSITEDPSNGGAWNMRNFIVNGNAVVYRKEPMVIDLTAVFGAGNEPSKEWCDANIPYFVGTMAVHVNGLAGVARKIKKGYIGVPEFVQPVLTADGTLGGSAFAVYASNYHSADYATYKAFNGSTSDGYSSSVNPSSQTIYLTMYNPVAIKISSLKFTNVPSGLTSSSPNAFSVQGSNDNSGWTTIGSFTNTNNTNGVTWSISLSGDYYKYHRLVITSANTTQAYMNIGEIDIVAMCDTSVSDSVVEDVKYDSVFANNTWSQIIEACQKNKVPSTWKVGDQKDMVINGKNYAIDIIGKDHDTYADGSGKAPLTLQTHDMYETMYAMNSSNTNNGGWTSSKMKSTHLPAILALMPNEVQAGIKEVNKLTSAGNSSSTINTTADKLFLLSEIEVYGKTTYSASGEGSQYDYYNAGNSKLKKVIGASVNEYWWTRSPVVGGNTQEFFTVSSVGEPHLTSANGSNGVSFAFCFGGTSQVNNTFGVTSVARKIKKAYIGIGGVARPCWSGGELAYYGSITALSVARSELAATTIGDYALFGGGQNYSSYYSTVDAYNASLVRSTPTALSVAKYTLGATPVGNYALFAGGQTKSSSISATVDTYNKSLTKSTATDLRVGRNNISATTIGNYALFAGGSSTTGYAYVDAYDSSLTRTSPTNLSESKTQLAATTIGDYALFAGGTTEPDAGYAKNSVDTYNKSLTKGTATSMQESKYLLAATTVGGYAIFLGGSTGYTFSGRTVDAYNASLTRTAAPTASKYNREMLAATSVEGFAIFAGGLDQDDVMNVVEVYDESLTKTMTTTLSAGRFRLSATTIGNYALFGGGRTANKSPNSNVEAFTVA